jgi:hypothetical protein
MQKPRFSRVEFPTKDKNRNLRDYAMEVVRYVGRIASTCSAVDLSIGKEYEVGERCLTDAAKNSPSKPWEFVPLRNAPCYHQNMRDFIKANPARNVTISFIDGLAYADPTDFYVFDCTHINMVWYQLSTHRANSPLKQSKRYMKEGHSITYWFPTFETRQRPWVVTRQFPFIHKVSRSEVLERVAHSMSPKQLTKVLHTVYRRKELRNRDHNAFELVNFKLCGSKEAFENLFNERSRNTCGSNVNCGLCEKKSRHCAQLETRMFVADMEADIYPSMQGSERYFQ